FFIFLTRRFHLIAFWIFLLFQAAIAVTGNYGFFNLLTVVLCFILLDDDAFGKAHAEKKSKPSRLSQAFFLPFAVLIVSVSGLEWVSQIFGRGIVPAPARDVLEVIAPFRSVNRYGLFAVMTTDRPEIIVEGSDDGSTWKAYEFKWKAGD